MRVRRLQALLHCGASAGCRLLLGCREPQVPSGGHMGANKQPLLVRGNSSPPVLGRAAPGPVQGPGW